MFVNTIVVLQWLREEKEASAYKKSETIPSRKVKIHCREPASGVPLLGSQAGPEMVGGPGSTGKASLLGVSNEELRRTWEH